MEHFIMLQGFLESFPEKGLFSSYGNLSDDNDYLGKVLPYAPLEFVQSQSNQLL